jgi:hypothetical protein
VNNGGFLAQGDEVQIGALENYSFSRETGLLTSELVGDLVNPRHVVVSITHPISFEEQITLLSQMFLTINKGEHIYYHSDLRTTHFYQVGSNVICDLAYPYQLVMPTFNKIECCVKIPSSCIHLVESIDLICHDVYLDTPARRACYVEQSKYGGIVKTTNGIILNCDEDPFEIRSGSMRCTAQNTFMYDFDSKNWSPKRMIVKTQSTNLKNIRVGCFTNKYKLFDWSFEFLMELGCVTIHEDFIVVQLPINYHILQCFSDVNEYMKVFSETETITSVDFSHITSNYPNKPSNMQPRHQLLETTEHFTVSDPVSNPLNMNKYELSPNLNYACKGYFIYGNVDQLTHITLVYNGHTRLDYSSSMVNLCCSRISDHLLYIPLHDPADNISPVTFNDVTKNSNHYRDGCTHYRLDRVKFILTYKQPQTLIEIYSRAILRVIYRTRGISIDPTD